MRDGLPQPGAVVADKFRVDRLVGRGGMGCVYAVTHLGTGRTLALKCLLPQYATDHAAMERFLREARAVGKIQHRHVVDIFDVAQDGPLCFLLMPYLEGLTFSELLDSETLTLQNALLILVRAMQGVAAAHALGMVHRDLKPANIMVCRGSDGVHDDPRVLDFGIAKMSVDEPTHLTQSGVTLGTPHYMAIEQLLAQRDIDVRADVFAMGVILYEALTGKLPHTASNVATLAIARLTEPPVDLARLRPDLPELLCRAVMRALSNEREQRQQTMDALAHEIQLFTNLVGVGPEALKLRPPAPRAASTLVGALVPSEGTADAEHSSSQADSAQRRPNARTSEPPSPSEDSKLVALLASLGISKPPPAGLIRHAQFWLVGLGGLALATWLWARPFGSESSRGTQPHSAALEAPQPHAPGPTHRTTRAATTVLALAPAEADEDAATSRSAAAAVDRSAASSTRSALRPARRRPAATPAPARPALEAAESSKPQDSPSRRRVAPTPEGLHLEEF